MREIDNLELEGSSGIDRKSKGIKDRGKLKFKIIWGAKVEKKKNLGGKSTGHLEAQDSLEVMMKRVGVAIGRKRLRCDRF